MRGHHLLVCLTSVVIVLGLGDWAIAKDIVILMDGTWNNSIQPADGDSRSAAYTVRVGEESTNIARMWDLLDKSPDQRVLYLRGIGTDGDPLDLPEGAFGGEATRRINRAHQFLSEVKWQPSDGICIFGFSRGAATARMLARKLHDVGIGGVRPVGIRFLGLFDTVASMGIPKLHTGDFTSLDSYYKAFDRQVRELAIPDSVKRVVHLVARDEERSVFAPTLVTLDSRGQGTIVEEVWFGGNHGDVGGGWKDAQESDKKFRRRMITLRYMLEREHGLALLPNWKDSEHVRVDPAFNRCGQKHGWSDYPFSTRITGRLKRWPTELPLGVRSPEFHPSADH